MRTYPLFIGEQVSNRITVELEPTLRNALETQCRAAWRELNKIPSVSTTSSPFTPYNELQKTTEGRTHIYLLDTLFYIPGFIPGTPPRPFAKPINVSELNAAMSRIQARRFNTRGRRKQVVPQAASAADYRKFRSWWISKHLADSLSVDFGKPCPFVPRITDGPSESYTIIGQRFEEWTGYKLPKELWAELKAREAERLAKLGNQQELQAA